MRAFAMFGVVMVHATSFATVDMRKDSLFGLYNFLNIFSKFGTTTFIFLSAFILFYTYFNQPFTMSDTIRFYKKRLKFIVVPYVLFSGFYFVLNWYGSGTAWDISLMMESFWLKLAIGKSHAHLYFIIINIQFYLLFPFLLFILKRLRKYAAAFVLIGITLQWGFYIGNALSWDVPNRNSWAFSFLSYYFLGAFAGIYYEKIKAWLLSQHSSDSSWRKVVFVLMGAVWISTSTMAVYIMYQERLHKVELHPLVFEAFWNAYTLITAMIFLIITVYIGNKKSWLLSIMRRIGVYSFGIYLVHPFILAIYRKFPPHTDSSLLKLAWYGGGFVMAIAASYAVIYAIARLGGWTWIFFGKLPGQLRDSRSSEKPARIAPEAKAWL